jgi:hypothetical protein
LAPRSTADPCYATRNSIRVSYSSLSLIDEGISEGQEAAEAYFTDHFVISNEIIGKERQKQCGKFGRACPGDIRSDYNIYSRMNIIYIIYIIVIEEGDHVSGFTDS